MATIARVLLPALALASMLAVSAESPESAPTRRPGPPGYLVPGALDIIAVLPAAPVPGDARDRADREIFRATRALQGTPRWEIAAVDAGGSPADLYRDFACALDLSLTPEAAPRLTTLLQRATRDAGAAIQASKAHYQRQRPYNVDEGPLCRPREETGDSYDYPSGHSLVGWTWALLLAELNPSQAGPVLARGRAFGESRVVCGVHNYSAVQAGQLAASALVATLHGSAEFRADLEAARAELAAVRERAAARAQPAACEVESTLLRPLAVPARPPAGP